MASKKQTTTEERNIVISLHKSGNSYRDIAKVLNRSHATIQCIVKRYKKENRVQNKTKTSNKKIFNDADERWILRKVRDDPKLSAPKLASEAALYLKKKCNAETIRRVLRKNGLNGRIARKKPYLSKKNITLRKKFAKDYGSKDFDFWKNVLFTDESKFNIFGSDGRVNVWRKPGQELNLKNLRPTVKHGGGHVMVWGCMSAAGVGNLHFIEGNMDKWMYLNILKKNLHESTANLGIRDRFHFYQDNDPKHSAHVVREWLLYNCPKVMQTPPQSPDLNVIENLWHILEINIRKHTITNKESLKNALRQEWLKICPKYTEKLVKSMQNRLKDVIKQKGQPTKY